jgi:hypothetical protein
MNWKKDRNGVYRCGCWSISPRDILGNKTFTVRNPSTGFVGFAAGVGRAKAMAAHNDPIKRSPSLIPLIARL